MTSRLQSFLVRFGMFQFSVRFVVCPDYQKSLRYMAPFVGEKSIQDEGYAPRGRCLYKRGYAPIVWVPQKPKTPRQHATLAHECLHAVGHMAGWADIAHTEATEEVYCHALGHLICEALTRMK